MEAKIKSIANIDDKTIKEKTGKAWDKWRKILDKHKNALETHGQKVQFLKQEYNLTSLLAEKITIRYEKELRELYIKMNEEHEISKSKTFECEIDKIYNFIKNLFLSSSFEFFPTQIIEDITNKNIEIVCNDKSHIIAYFYSKNDKTQLIVQHAKLKNARMYEDIRKFWMRKLREIEKEIIY